MLRWKLGDSLFFLALKNYLTDPKLAGNYAYTSDLKNQLEKTSGQNLTEFFNDWYFNQGYPSYKLLWEQEENTVTVQVNQTTSHPSVSFFEMPIPIKFIGANKDTTIIFNHTYSGEKFSETINFKIKNIQFDPELHLLSNQNRVIEIGKIINRISIYPKPTKTNLTILFDFNNYETVLIEAFDIGGKILISKNETISVGESLKTFYTESLAKGEYVLRITGENIIYTEKFMKE
jgi:hypothetical protein